MTKFLAAMTGLLAFSVALAVLLGFAGRAHPMFDTLSLLRPVLASLCILVCFLPLVRWIRGMVILAALAGLGTTAPLLLPGTEGGTLRVYSKNLWYRNSQLPALAQDIRDSGADVVMLQEVSDRNATILADLAADFPHQHQCRPTPKRRNAQGWSAG